MKIALLGSTGFVGAAVTPALLDAGHELRLLVRDPAKAKAWAERGAELVQGDIVDPEALSKVCLGVETVVSLVAVRRNRPRSYLEVNVDGPRLLAHAARTSGRVRHIVFISAIGGRLDRHYRYLSSRWMGEEELRKSGAPLTILRFSLVLGEGGGVFADFERAANFGPVIVIPGSGQARFQPLIREDAARCVAETVGRRELIGREFDLGGPEVLTYDRLFDLYATTRGVTKRRVHVPGSLLQPGTAAMELVVSDPIATPDEVRTIQLDNLGQSLDVVQSQFGFSPQAPTAWIPQHWR
ncbi:MAG TPA: NAD(P)H-binding protein [Candidatus Dormibacteraeota bacterium]